MDFVGAKLVCLIGDRLLTLLRDERDDIAYPGWWDMPGGGREAGESPEACVLRETREEFGLELDVAALVWRAVFDSPTSPGLQAYWFAARLPATTEARIVFGDEGQTWALMKPAD
jgi:8-oxo-dGTP diphosphatase